MTADDLVSVYVSAGVGIYGGPIGNMFIGSKASIPSGPGPYLSIRVTGGSGPSGTHNSTLIPAYLRPNVQVVVRAEDLADAEVMALAAYNATFPIRNRFINGTWWVQVIMLQSEPYDIGEDDNARPRLAFNFSCEKRPTAAAS